MKNYKVVAFTQTGSHTWTVPEGVESVDVLVVAGGGGGGGIIGAGGGAGGLIFQSNRAVVPGSIINIIVGAGGVGGHGWNNATDQHGKPGENSIFDNLTAIGGGGGKPHSGTLLYCNGGSGGGGNAQGSVAGGLGTAGQGHDGGAGDGTDHRAGGGGGAGQPGYNATASGSGNGGDGLYFGNVFGDKYGASGWFAGGGGAGVRSGYGTAGTGGKGGAGSGTTTSVKAGNAVANTGSGGGGAGYNVLAATSLLGGNGGSGIVLIRYAVTQLDYWIESTTGKTWLKVPELLPFETRMFYAKKTAGYAPDGKATFNHYDQFDNVDAWAAVVGKAKANISTDRSFIGNTSVKIQTGTLMETLDRRDITDDNAVYEVMLYIPATTVSAQTVMWLTYDNAIGAAVGINQVNSTTKFVYRFDATWYVSSISLTVGWHKLGISYDGSLVKLMVDDVVVGSRAYTAPTQYVGLGDWWNENNTSAVYLDAFRVRKCATAEPTVSVKDAGSHYIISVTNNLSEVLTDFQVAVNSADLALSSTAESLQILPVHRSERSNVPYMDLFDGCKAYWDLLGDVQDVMGNFNGSVSGAVLATGRFGVHNSGYTVSGTQYITTNYVLQAPTNSNLFTVLQWVYFDGVNTAAVFGSDASATGHFHLNAYIASTMYGLGKSYFGGTTSDGPDEVPKTPAVGWYLVGVTKTATKTFDVYVNGVKEISGAIRQATTSTKLNFGRAYVNHTAGAGIIGESLAFDKALTEEQHRIMYEVMSRFRVYPIMHPRRLLP